VNPYIIARLKIMKNSLLPFGAGKLLLLVLFSVIAFSFVLLDYLFFQRIFSNLFKIEAIPEKILLILSSKLMSLVFLTTYTMLIFSSAVSTLSYLYLENDLELLFSLPLKRFGLRSWRLLHAFFNAGIMVFLLVFPILLGYFEVRHKSPAMALLSFICFFLYLLAPIAWGASITVILSRYFPAKRLHQFFTVLGITLLTILVLFFRLARPEALMNPKNALKIEEIAASIALPQESSLPSTWLSRAIVVAGEGDGERFIHYSADLAALAIASVLLLGFVVFLFHSGGYARAEAKKGAWTRSEKIPMDRLLLRTLKLVPLGKDARAVIFRDSLVFFRSPTEWGQLFILGALVIIYIFNIKYLPKEIAPFRVAVTLLNFATLCFVVASVAARFAFTSLAGEGKAFFTSKALPMAPGKYVLAKVLFTALPLSVFSTGTFFFAGRLIELEGIPMIYFLSAALLSSLFLTLMAVYMGAKAPLFDERNPAKMLVTVNGFLYMFFSMVYVAMLTVASAKPVYHFYTEMRAGGSGSEIWLSALRWVLVINLPAVPFYFLTVRKMVGIEQK
jgi:ABC-2 type transport system permease protein